MIEVTDAQLDLVRRILSSRLPGRAVRAFGSRVAGKARVHSDLDLAVLGDDPVTDLERAQLRDDFEDCDLPFRVDVLFWPETPAALRESIMAASEPIID